MEEIIHVMILLIFLTMVLGAMVFMTDKMMQEIESDTPILEPESIPEQTGKSRSLLYVIISIIITGVASYYVLKKKNLIGKTQKPDSHIKSAL